ncbi:MAG: hypothetical protein IK088_02390, partial [Lachnospiraceae bacterium]|nr:hypothetical protein [Lachnospiraceae bacterium]
MEFNDLRLQDIRTVVYYCSRKIHFSASARQDHFIGINLSGTAYHDLGYKKLDLYPNYIYFFNQRDDFVGTTKEYGYCYSIHFTTVEPIETDSFCKKVTNPDVFVQKIRAVERAWLKKENGILQMRSLFYDFCSFMLHVMSTPYAS